MIIKWIKRVLFGLTAACIALLPQFYAIFDGQNRYALLWNHSYHAAIVVSVVIMASLFGSIYCLVYYIWKPAGLKRYVCDVILCMFLYGLLVRTGMALLDRAGYLDAGLLSHLIGRVQKLFYYVILPLPVIAAWVSTAKLALRRAYAVISPVAAFVLVWPLTFETYDESTPPLPAQYLRTSTMPSPHATRNVYIFIFDEWSYSRTFPGDRAWSPMTNLAALVAGADLYERAYSPGKSTRISIPRILFQHDPAFRAMSDAQVWDTVVKQGRCSAASIFTAVDSSWFKVALSFYLDFPRLLGSQVNYAARIHQGSPHRLVPEIRFLLRSQIAWISHFGVPFHQYEVHPSLYWSYSQEIIHRQSRRVIEEAQPPTMAVFHYCLPHAPFVWNRDGRKNPMPSNFTEHSVKNYQDNLLYLDRVIGEIVESLKRSGKYDSSLLICTSDHSWRNDPALVDHLVADDASVENPDVLHVPLIVKNIGQTEATVNRTPIQTRDLYAVLAQAAISPPPAK